VVDWGGGVFASCCRGSNCSLTRAINGRISVAAPMALADQLPLPMIEKHGWSGFVPVRRAIKESLALAFAITSFLTRHKPINCCRPVVTSVHAQVKMLVSFNTATCCMQQRHLPVRCCLSASPLKLMSNNAKSQGQTDKTDF